MNHEAPDTRSADAFWPQDPHLAQALRHAPEPTLAPGVAVRDAVLAHAQARLGSRRSASGSSAMWHKWLRWWQTWGSAPLAWGGALTSLLVVVLAGVLWGTQERQEQAMVVASAPVAATPPQERVRSPAVAEVAPTTAKPVPPTTTAPTRAAAKGTQGAAPTAAADAVANAVAEAPQSPEVAVASPAAPAAMLKVAPAPELRRERSVDSAARRLFTSAVWERALASAESADKMPEPSAPGLTWLDQPPPMAPARIYWMATERRLWWEQSQQRWQTTLSPQDAAAWQNLWDAARQSAP